MPDVASLPFALSHYGIVLLIIAAVCLAANFTVSDRPRDSARTDKCQPHFVLFSIEHHPP